LVGTYFSAAGFVAGLEPVTARSAGPAVKVLLLGRKRQNLAERFASLTLGTVVIQESIFTEVEWRLGFVVGAIMIAPIRI